jgi:hypothetical protein
MLTPESAKERVFCPHCGQATAIDMSGEGDWACSVDACYKLHRFIRPLFERDLQGAELIRLRLEAEQLRATIRSLSGWVP